MVEPYTAFLAAGSPSLAAISMRFRNKQITLYILTGMTATEASRVHGITRRTVRGIVQRVIDEAMSDTWCIVPRVVHSITSAKAMSDRLIPIVHNHYQV